jgi:hypothetical protein
MLIYNNNVNTSRQAQTSLLEEAASQGADLICLQEPAVFTSQQKQYYTLQWPGYYCIIPTSQARPRAISYVKKHSLYSFSFQPIQDPDIQHCIISSSFSAPYSLINIYNEKDPDKVYTADRLLSKIALKPRAILVGDLNAHYSWWNPSLQPTMYKNYKAILAWSRANRATLLTPPNQYTFFRKNTQPSVLDLAFSKGFRANTWLITYLGLMGSDHTPFKLTLQKQQPILPTSMLNYNKADWPLFTKQLQQIHFPLTPIPTTLTLEELSNQLTIAIQEASKVAIPYIKIRKQTKKWWTTELTQAKENLKKIGKSLQKAHIYKKHRKIQQCNQQYWAQKQLFQKLIDKTKKTHWLNYLEQAKGRDIFNILKYSRPQAIPNIPHLLNSQDSYATTFTEKANLLKSTLYPQSLPTPLSTPNIPTTSTWPWPVVSPSEIKKAIFTSNIKKAAGPDLINFLCIQKAYQAIPTVFTYLYTQLAIVGYHPLSWRHSLAVIIPKPNKPDYSLPKAYRPISLLNCLGKVLEKILATRLGYIANNYISSSPIHSLLHYSQIGGRQQRSSTDAALILVDFIQKNKIQKNQPTSTVFLDIKGAFDHINRQQLINKIKGLGLPTCLLKWVKCFLSNRTQQLCFNNQKSDVFNINIGIPQGSPISPILFLVYVHSILLNNLPKTPAFSNILQLSYIDDFSLSVASPSITQNISLLKLLIQTIFNKAQANKACFEPSKTELIHFTSIKKDQEKPLLLPVLSLKLSPTSTVKWLGFYFTSTLSFKHHINIKTNQAKSAFQALLRLGNSQKGLTLQALRQLYLACIASIANYGSILWFRPDSSPSSLQPLLALHYSALCKISGAFKGTLRRVLEIETALLPVPIRLLKNQLKFALRLKQVQANHPILQLYPTTYTPLTTNQLTQLDYILSLTKHTFNLPLSTLHIKTTPILPPWDPPYPSYLSFSINPNNTFTLHKSLLYKLQQDLQQPLILYTDGSRGQASPSFSSSKITSSAAFISLTLPNIITYKDSWNLGPCTEVFDAETSALFQAISYISTTIHSLKNKLLKDPFLPISIPKKAYVFCDSQAAILAFQKGGTIYTKLLAKLVDSLVGIQVIVAWVPSHQGIFGNEVVDKLAKQALGQTRARQSYISTSYLSRLLKQTIKAKWQLSWNKSTIPSLPSTSISSPLPIKPDFYYKQAYTRWLEASQGPDYPLTLSRSQAASRLIQTSVLQLMLGVGWLPPFIQALGGDLKHTSCLGTCSVEATTKHLLIECELYSSERKQAFQGLPRVDLFTLFRTPPGRQALFQFVGATRIGSAKWVKTYW